MKECAKHAREEDVDAKVRNSCPDDDSLILQLLAFVHMKIVLIHAIVKMFTSNQFPSFSNFIQQNGDGSINKVTTI